MAEDTAPPYSTLPICRGIVHSMADEKGMTHPVSSVYEIDGKIVVTALEG